MNNLNAGLASNDVLNALLRVYDQVLNNKRYEEPKRALSPLPEPYTLDTKGKLWNHWNQPAGPQVMGAQTASAPVGDGSTGPISWEEFIAIAGKILSEEGVPANVGLAQAAVETGRGKSAPGHNYFGMKGTGTAGSNALKTKEAGADGELYNTTGQFAGYKTATDSAKAYSKLLKTDPRYKKAWDARKNPRKMIEEIHKAGYATDPNYINIVTNTPEFRGEYGR